MILDSTSENRKRDQNQNLVEIHPRVRELSSGQTDTQSDTMITTPALPLQGVSKKVAP